MTKKMRTIGLSMIMMTKRREMNMMQMLRKMMTLTMSWEIL